MTKEALSYFKAATDLLKKDPASFRHKASIRLITNFTDTPLSRIISGMCAEEGIYPLVSSIPYKQYHLFLKEPKKILGDEPADITFIFFDVHNYGESAFKSDPNHFEEILSDLARYAAIDSQPIVVSTFPSPYRGIYGNLFTESPLHKQVEKANTELKKLAEEIPNLYLWDANRLLHWHGESRARDFRGLYAFDMPFNNDFLTLAAEEWLGFIRARLGLTKKCLVLDLDNTLWGGVVGEVGPNGISLGPDYPGSAFLGFQKSILELYERGVILALNSRNNPADVEEVFKTNPNMVLKMEHFSAIRINWEDKATNISSIAEELNIGTDSMVFVDDDRMNRDLVRTMLPEVAVPEFSIPAEDYAHTLFSFTYFYQFSLTSEDRKKGKMYAEEKQRKDVEKSAQNLEEYIAALNIQAKMHLNSTTLLPRTSQLTLKTNQCNLTTKRYTEKEISDLMNQGGLVYAVDVTDKFGDYGTTAVIIATKQGNTAHLDSFLMSCRIMGRGVEYALFHFLAKELSEMGINTLTAEFIPTAKNDPSKDFLSSAGFKETSRNENGAISYSMELASHLASPQTQAVSTISVEKAK